VAAWSVQQPQLHAVADLVHTLHEQCAVVSRILSDVLSLQKMEDGRFTLEMVPFSPEQLVCSTVESFQQSFETRRQTVAVKLQKSFPQQTSLNATGADVHAPFSQPFQVAGSGVPALLVGGKAL